jgi:hypothetical protein
MIEEVSGMAEGIDDLLKKTFVSVRFVIPVETGVRSRSENTGFPPSRE